MRLDAQMMKAIITSGTKDQSTMFGVAPVIEREAKIGDTKVGKNGDTLVAVANPNKNGIMWVKQGKQQNYAGKNPKWNIDKVKNMFGNNTQQMNMFAKGFKPFDASKHPHDPKSGQFTSTHPMESIITGKPIEKGKHYLEQLYEEFKKHIVGEYKTPIPDLTIKVTANDFMKFAGIKIGVSKHRFDEIVSKKDFNWSDLKNYDKERLRVLKYIKNLLLHPDNIWEFKGNPHGKIDNGDYIFESKYNHNLKKIIISLDGKIKTGGLFFENYVNDNKGKLIYSKKIGLMKKSINPDNQSRCMAQPLVGTTTTQSICHPKWKEEGNSKKKISSERNMQKNNSSSNNIFKSAGKTYTIFGKSIKLTKNKIRVQL